MKKIIVGFVLLLVPLVTGCTNIDSQLTLNDDKSAQVVSSLTYQGDLSNKDDVVAQTINGNYSNFLDSEYKIENVYGAKLSTITATKGVKNLKRRDIDLSSLGFKSNFKNGRFVQIRKSFLVTSYNIDMSYNLQMAELGIHKYQKTISKKESGLQPEYYQKYGDPSEYGDDSSASDDDDLASNMDDDTKQFVKKSMSDADKNSKPVTIDDLNASFSIKVPSFASYNNADSFEGNVYTWNLKKDGPTVIKLQYVRYSGFAISFIIVFGIALLIFIARKIHKHDAQKRIDN